MRICTLVCISLSLLCVGCSFPFIDKTEELKIFEDEIDIGLSEPMDIMFIADTHISLCDDRDSGLKDKAKARYSMFLSPKGIGADKVFATEMEYVKNESPDLLVLGGDIIDSAMYASVDYVKEELDKTAIPYVYGMGNHDFEYGDEYYTDRAYTEYLPRLSDISDTSDGYQAVDYREFTVLVVDDANNQVSAGALNKLRELTEAGRPVILCMHVPIEPDEGYADGLIQKSIDAWGSTDDGRSRVILGDHGCIPNDVTREFIDIVRSDDSTIRAVLAGHVHFQDESEIRDGLPQLVTGAGFEGYMINLHIE